MGVSQDLSDYPPYFEDHQDYKDFCISYRGDLARIVKLTAGLLPDQALAAASRRLQNAMHQCSTSSASPAVCYPLFTPLHQVDAKGVTGYALLGHGMLGQKCSARVRMTSGSYVWTLMTSIIKCI